MGADPSLTTETSPRLLFATENPRVASPSNGLFTISLKPDGSLGHPDPLAGGGGAALPTVSVAEAVLPSEVVATMLVDPAARAVTTPDVVTVPTAVLLLDQDTFPADVGLPEESLAVTVNCELCPTPIVVVPGATATEATAVD